MMNVTIEDQDPRDEIMRRSWKILLGRGIAIVLVGFVLLIKPSSGLSVTAVLFSLFLTIDGITLMTVGFRMSSHNQLWWGSVIRGAVEIILAAVIISHPKGFGELGASALLILLGVVFLISGVIDYQFKGGTKGTFSSIILFSLGILLLAAPLFAANVILRLIGLTSIAGGAARIYRAFQYRNRIN